ncbi:hypothetical protein H4R18_001518 [Coemansia javaensis]|uniref:Uncharacterized protein n=1 Tax=Coemansia javaensis TaxID=2761396 RepID=A0A9W8LK57_9FUNG|nr:hypothetical protein H4R18_001518 [Coemansia javaensis]
MSREARGMRDQLALYTHAGTHSDDTVCASSGSEGCGAQQRQKQQQQHCATGMAGGPHPAPQPQGVPISRTHHHHHHRRSVSLLSRLRHGGGGGSGGSGSSPTGSPTSSEASSRDTRSDRTLAHSASSGSMRGQSRAARAAADKERHRPAVRVLPPADDAGPVARKRGSLRGERAGGFISQLLRGGGGAGPQHHHHHHNHNHNHSQHQHSRQAAAGPLPADAAGIRHFVRSPGTPRSHRSAGSRSAGSQSPASVDEPDVGDDGPQEHFHVSQCRFGQPAAPPPPPGGGECGFADALPAGPHQPGGYAACSGGGGVFYVGGGGGGPGGVVDHGADDQDGDGDMGDPYGGWYGDGADGMHTAGRLVSALPVYEPIDMGRFEAQHGGYVRATRPALPDVRMLAPMASLADVCEAGGMGEYGALSNRELRFAVENHMLVEQHRYLIRDLGHARSAISALKQVVQTKEERHDHFEAANMELQQRVALLESILTPEQRHQLACLPYAFVSATGQQAPAPGEGAPPWAAQQQQQHHHHHHHHQGGLGLRSEGPAAAGDDNNDDDDDDDGDEDDGSDAAPAPAKDADGRRATRPLSGYATGFSLSDRPVRQLPRVFSGDYSASEVQAMETSVEALASAIAGMPRDADSVDDIIASKADAVPPPPPPASDSGCSDTESERQSGRPAAASPTAQKRRSRFFHALRLAGRGAAPASAAPEAEAEAEPAADHKRRSVSLGNGSGSPPAPAPKRTGSHGSLAASCPVLAPGPAKQRLASSGSSGRYPSGLGLGGPSDGSRASSAASSSSLSSSAVATIQVAAAAAAAVGGRKGRRASKRLSLSAQPRRSTSAPSRPHSMRVSGRRSWIAQLFGGGGGGGRTLSDDPGPDRPSDADESAEDEPCGGARARRRRVMTQSSDEISHFLGKLRLEEPLPPARAGASVLEDVVDVSGEDEERASRPSLSVSEIRQQTLDALNGTVRGREPASGGEEPGSSPGAVDAAGSRWRQRDAAAPTIRRLTPPDRGDASTAQSGGSRGRRSQSWAPEDGERSGAPRQWAPAFWTPPAWSPRSSGDSLDAAGGRRGSDEARLRPGAGSGGRRGSPWELVKAPDARGFPLSPGRALAFFEDAAVPDADELTMAARRSLSLRMSHTSFKQAEPLPESDPDPPPDDGAGSGTGTDVSRPATPSHLHLRNAALDRVAAVQPKRRSLLRQLTPRTHPPRPESPVLPPAQRRTRKWWAAVLG